MSITSPASSDIDHVFARTDCGFPHPRIQEQTSPPHLTAPPSLRILGATPPPQTTPMYPPTTPTLNLNPDRRHRNHTVTTPDPKSAHSSSFNPHQTGPGSACKTSCKHQALAGRHHNPSWRRHGDNKCGQRSNVGLLPAHAQVHRQRHTLVRRTRLAAGVFRHNGGEGTRSVRW